MEEENSGRVLGFMLATVLSNGDDKKKGKLKLRLLCEGQAKEVLEDVKVITPFAGERYGVYCLPEVGEQVLVGFLDGCFDRPFVFGSVYTASDKMVADSFHKSNALKRLVTKGGTVVEISDEKKEEAVRVETPEKKLRVELSQKEQTVTVSAGKNTIVVNGKDGCVKLEAQKEIQFKVGKSSIKMDSGGNVKLEGVKITAKGQSVSVSADGQLALKGQSTQVKGSMVDIKSDGMMQIKGSITKIN